MNPRRWLVPAAPTTISVHLRQKESMKEQCYGFLSGDKYEEAIARTQAALSNAIFFAFFDHIDWRCDSFKAYSNSSFLGSNAGLHDHKELMLMSMSDYQIIAHSSCSCWGAFLCRNRQQQAFGVPPCYLRILSCTLRLLLSRALDCGDQLTKLTPTMHLSTDLQAR